MLGPVPACMIVFFGYLSILTASVFIKNSKSKHLFYLGWIPVFLLALIGVGLELTQGHICPPGAGGIPQCFYSFAMASITWALFINIYTKSHSLVSEHE